MAAARSGGWIERAATSEDGLSIPLPRGSPKREVLGPLSTRPRSAPTEPCVGVVVPVHATRQTQFLEGRPACRQLPESAGVSSGLIWLVGLRLVGLRLVGLRLASLIYPSGATGMGVGQGKNIGGAR